MRINLFVSGQVSDRSIVRVQWWFRCAIALCALIDCWICRFQMGPDGVSYLDLGDLYWKGDWQSALNSYWSPLYGCLAGLMLRITTPSMRWEYPEIHLLNFAIFVVTLGCFEFFWRQVLAARGKNAWTGASLLYAWVMGYLLFACIHFGAEGLARVQPDTLVAAIVYLTSGLMLRFIAGQMGASSAWVLGVLLGLGYLAKAAMLPFAFIVILTMLASALSGRGKKSIVGATFLGFMILSLPFITALSLHQHRVTFGDSAKLNQAWFVNHDWFANGVTRKYRHWHGESAGRDTAQHPTRPIYGSPEIYEFATPVAGTYAVWYDPTYWNAGIDSSVHPKLEVKAFLKNLAQIASYLSRTIGVLTTIILIVFLVSDRIEEAWRQLMHFRPILIPAVAVFLMYAMVYWEQRYTSGPTLVCCAAVMASASISQEEWRNKVLRAACLILGAVVVFWVLPLLMLNRNGEHSEEQVLAAVQLRTMGMQPGDRVAVIGDGYDEEYWARLAKVRIVAEVPQDLETGDSAAKFWNSSPVLEEKVLDILKSTGVKAVIAETAPGNLPSGWVRVGDMGRAAYFFR